MTATMEPIDPPRLRAVDAIEAAVLGSMDKASANPFSFGDDEIPDVADAETVAAVALTALCTIVEVSGLRESRVRHIFRTIRAEEEAR